MSSMLEQLYYFKQHRIESVKKSQRLSERNGIDIYRSALLRLEGDCFNIEEIGSQDIAKIIYRLYHERWLLEKYYKRPSYEGYWDLSDPKNPHYKSLGSGKRIIGEMRESIINSSCEEDNADLNELLYDLCDLEIRKYNEDNREPEERISYKKLLLK